MSSDTSSSILTGPGDASQAAVGAGEQGAPVTAERFGVRARSWVRSLYEVSDKPSRLVAMEGVRGFAVLLVFFVHYHSIFSPYVNSTSPVYAVSEFLGVIGNAGVDLFFVLSGYLIYAMLLRKQTPYFKFISRRIERIYPAFLVVLGFYLAIFLVSPRISRVHGSVLSTGVYILENVLLLPGVFSIPPIVTVTWSLSYEFLFYLSIPLVIGLTRMCRWPRLARVIFFLIVWLSCISFSFTVARSQVRLLMFIPGILLYEALSAARLKGKLTSRGEICAILLFVMSLVFAWLLSAREAWVAFLPALHAGNTVLPGITTYQGPYKVITLGISCFCFALFCFGFGGSLSRAFSWRPIRYLGNMSYSYFLFHGFTLKAISALLFAIVAPSGRSPILMCLLLPFAFAATWVTSTVLFAFVEKPFSLERLPLSAYLRALGAPVRHSVAGGKSPSQV